VRITPVSIRPKDTATIISQAKKNTEGLLQSPGWLEAEDPASCWGGNVIDYAPSLFFTYYTGWETLLAMVQKNSLFNQYVGKPL
jgi:hypothetical protein